jgi:hypothetical protein
MHGAEGLARAVRTLLGHADFWLAYRALALAFEGLDLGAWLDLEGLARARFGDRVDYLRPVYDERRRQQNIVDRRAQIHDADHRFLLALLLNVPTRDGIYRLLAGRYPDAEPRELVVRWVGELAAQQRIGLDFTPLSLVVLECALEDATLADVRTSLCKVFPAEQVAAQEWKLQQLWDEIRDALLLKPLFATSA